MKKILSTILMVLITMSYTGLSSVMAAQNVPQQRVIQPAPNARKIDLAFVFDGPSDKNEAVLKTFQQTIAKSLLPDFIAQFPQDLVFTGDWSEKSAIEMSEKALKSRATTVISLGYLSSDYLQDKKNKNKFVITIDEYGLRDMGSSAFFNPLKQSVNDFILFKKLVPSQKTTAVLMNENFYNTRKDWNGLIKSKLKEKNCDLDIVLIPVNGKDVKSVVNKIPDSVDSVFVTPLFNLTTEQRKLLYTYINDKKLPSFSTLGEEDVDFGAMLGTSTPDVDRKLAESTSFNIHGVLHGNIVKDEKIPFYDDKVIFYNKDSGEAVGYSAPLRLLNNCEIISHKELPKYDLATILNTFEDNNLDIKQKKYLVDAARRSTMAAYMKYLPTLRIDLGYQTYNGDYAKSYSDVPQRAGLFTIGMDQMIYAPDLVTNIIVKHKKLKFNKAEKILTEQSLGLNLGFLYIDLLKLENAIKVQDEHLTETRENLAIARVREKKGLCGREETMRWAGQVSEEEKKLLAMKADYKNIKVQVNKILYKDQKQDFNLVPLTASDPAFFSSDLHIIDHVRTPEKLDKFTEMLVDEVVTLSPETLKLRAAIAMKKAEMGNYVQKFFLPNAMLTMEYGSQYDRMLPYNKYATTSMKQLQTMYGLTGLDQLDKNSGRFMIAAQWKPIEGGQKFAEIARCKSELNQLNAYLEEVNTELEMTIREVINRAISKYFMIEKSYKAMFAEAENYKMVKTNYLMGKAPITQLVDAQELYTKAKIDAMNSQYEFFSELLWVQRGLLSINWTKATDEAKKFIKGIPDVLPAEPDFSL